MELGPHKGHVNCRDFNIFSSHDLLPSDLVGQSVERRRSNPKVVGSIPTLVRVFLCPCVGPVPSVGLTLTWFIWDRNLALHVTRTLFSLFSNYRPVSVLPAFSKILEKLVYNPLIKYLEKYDILSSNQYGSRKNHSAFHALVHLQDKISAAIDI